MMTRNSKLILTSILVLILGGLLWGVSQYQRNAEAANWGQVESREWPAFTMVYDITSFTSKGESATQTIQLRYQHKQQWRVEILDHSTIPEVIGTWSEYNGQEVRHFDPRVGAVTVNKDMPQNGVYVPEEWLNPIYVAKLLTKSTTVNTVDGQTATGTLIATEVLPCLESTVANEGAVCEGNRIAQTQVQYRTIDLIPLLIVDTLDGVEVRRISVTNLTFDTP